MVENENSLSKVTPDNPYYLAVMALVGHERPVDKLPQAEETDEQNEQNRFGLALKLARRANKLSQERLAEKVGVNASHLSRIERGERSPPRRRTILRLAEALNFADRTDRLYFILFSGRATLEDIEGTNFGQTIKQMPEATKE